MDNPTPEQIKRYNELRDSGKTPLDATRIVRAEAQDQKPEKRSR
jgi:hypothetical protein